MLQTSVVNMVTPTIFEFIILLHCLPVLCDVVKKKTIAVHLNYHAGTLIGFRVQRLRRTCTKTFRRSQSTVSLKEIL